eukprot:7062207-Prymnesium_polylepis.1
MWGDPAGAMCRRCWSVKDLRVKKKKRHSHGTHATRRTRRSTDSHTTGSLAAFYTQLRSHAHGTTEFLPPRRCGRVVGDESCAALSALVALTSLSF